MNSSGKAHKGAWMDQPDKEINYKYNGIELADDIGLNVNLATFRTLDPAIGRWWQVDPYAESFYSMSPYCSMGNNPILYSDPDGDFIAQVIGGVVGAGVNVFSNWDKILANPWSAVGYVASGAVGGAVATINPALGRSIAAAGNVATDVASGNIPSFDGFGDIAAYGGGIALDAFSVGGAGKIGNLANTSLKNAAKKGAREIGEEVLGSGAFGQDLVFESSLDIINDVGNVTFSFGDVGVKPIISASTPSLLGASITTGIGATVSNGITIDPSNQVDRNLLNKPNKPGNAPTFKSDGTRVEIHHKGPEGPYKEMHWEKHRGAGNYNKNHPPGQHQPLTKAQRKKFNSQRESYWKKVFKKWK